jgi:D-glycero-D-manno-heptose 1,7-bisphosphate phosphatase
MSLRLVCLDRDGVLNEDRDDYIKSVAEFVMLPGAAEAVARLNRAGYPVVVITNQSPVGRGLITPDTLEAIHTELRRCLSAAGAKLAKIYHCPHHPDDHCLCRKPQPGMLLEATCDFGVDPAEIVFIGDTQGDMEAGYAAGCRTVLVRTGKGAEADVSTWPVQPDAVVADLSAAVDWILEGEVRPGSGQGRQVAVSDPVLSIRKEASLCVS